MDTRLGRKNADGSVEVWPERYPDGAAFNRLERAATTLMLDERHFVALPMRVRGLPDDLRDELLATVSKSAPKSKAVKDTEESEA